MNLKLVYCRRWLDVITQRLTARETTNYHIDSKMPFTAGMRFWFHDQQSCQLRMLSSPTTIQTPEDSSLDWFVRCLILGLLLSLGANAASYFFRSENIVDLIGNNQQVSEAIGFPDVYWRDSENVKTLPTRKHEGLVNYPVLGWNLMYGLISGVVLGILAAVFRQRLNELTKKKIQLRSRQSGSFFQISMHGILLLTTVVSLTVAGSANLMTFIASQSCPATWLRWVTTHSLKRWKSNSTPVRFINISESPKKFTENSNQLTRWEATLAGTFATNIRMNAQLVKKPA